MRDLMVFKRFSIPALMLAGLLVGCVTINVYFPAVAAEKAADRIIDDVLGPQPQEPQSDSGAANDVLSYAREFAVKAVNFVVPVAHAQANIDISSPAIQELKAAMQQRHAELEPYYASGAIGFAANGQVGIRDQNAIPLAQRNTVRKLVSAENQNRAALYKEIAVANGHPEWEQDIRNTFAQRWIAKARSGWWYQDAQGNWQQK